MCHPLLSLSLVKLARLETRLNYFRLTPCETGTTPGILTRGHVLDVVVTPWNVHLGHESTPKR